MSRNKQINDFMRDNYDRINLVVKKGYKDKLKTALRERHGGQSINSFISSYIETAIAEPARATAAAEAKQRTTENPIAETTKLEAPGAILIEGDLDTATVTNKQAAYLLGMNPRSMSKLVKEGQLARPPGNNKLVMLHSVVERAKQRGIDISGKLASY